ncbi:MAG: hypothetical protein KJO08_05415 [Gammaproteobacteria bacterium]|nr:hypothetical protein [Gammaproteobacteria bacterium]NNJ85049.1 hypothetical protein [Gammaproteobacteria bacterium]
MVGALRLPTLQFYNENQSSRVRQLIAGKVNTERDKNIDRLHQKIERFYLFMEADHFFIEEKDFLMEQEHFLIEQFYFLMERNHLRTDFLPDRPPFSH